MASAFEFPELDPLADSALLCVNMQLLPFVLGAVKELEDRKYWQTDQDWYRASESIGSFLEQSMAGCFSELLESNNRLYRLLDAGLNGTVYTAAGDPVVITPEIGAVPTDLSVLPGMIARLDHVEVMLDELPGVLDPGWFGYGGSKATLADVVRSLRIGSESASTETIDSLQEILGAGADLTGMAETIFELFSGTVSAVAEGGIFVLLAAGIMGQLAAAGALSTQLQVIALQLTRVIATLDGGSFGPPSDNILQAIRGDEDASATRNVIDSIVGALATLDTDSPEVLAKLEEIRVLLV